MNESTDRTLRYDITSHWRVVRSGLRSLDTGMSDPTAGRRAVLVSSPSCWASGTPSWVAERLGLEIVGSMPSCSSHSPVEDVLTLAAVIRDASPDAVVAVGGGSVMCTAKAARGAAELALDEVRTIMAWLRGDRQPTVSDDISFLAVPVTLAGAEFTNAVAITDSVAKEKVVVQVPGAAPHEVILDPRAATAPPDVWLSTGMKTFSDACEMLMSPVAEPITEALVTQAARLFREHLRASLERDTSRLACQRATWMTMFQIGQASGVVTGIATSIRHQLAPIVGVSPGEIAAALLLPVIRFNWWAIEPRRPALCRALGLGDKALLDDVEEVVTAFIDAVGLPQVLDISLSDRDLEHIAGLAYPHFVTRANPRHVSGPGELATLVKEACRP